MRRLRIDESFVIEWSDRYCQEMRHEEAAFEEHLFTAVSAACRERGYLNRSELMEIGRWKSPRARPRLQQNDARRVREISSLALAPQAIERASVLTALTGVGEPMASAVLTVWDPRHYTVFDWRARQTLEDAGVFSARLGRLSFGLYLAECRQLAERLDLPDATPSKLRLLDRALWKYSQRKPKGE